MFLRCFFVLLISLGLALPARAVLTLGVAPDNRSQLRSESAALQLAAQLQGVLKEDVRLRVFRSEVELNEWMQRYRVVDLALVSHEFYTQQPAGSLQLLSQPSGSDLAVARPGLSPETLIRLRNAMPALESILPAPLAQPAPQKTAAQRTSRPAPTALRPSDQELQAGQEILATPGQAPRITAQPARPVRRAQAKQQISATAPKVARATTTPPATAAAVAPKPSAPVMATPAPTAAAPTPAPALVLPPPQPAPADPVTASPPPSQEATAPPATPLDTPAAPEVQPESASAIPWLGILVLVGGFGYLFHRRRQKSRPIDWSAVNQKQPRPIPGENPKKPAPRPSKAPLEKDPAVPRGITASRVVLPPTRKAVEAAAAPAPEPVRPTEAIALVEETPAGTDSMAALLTDDTPLTFAEDHQSIDLPSLDLEDLPTLEVQIPPLELDESSPASPDGLPTLPIPTAVAAEPEIEDKTDFPSPVERKSRQSTSLPPLRGDIATVDIQRLLEAAAAQPAPCILHIRGRHDEKRLHFRKGHLSDAASVNRANRTKTGFLMNKVGYLLIRQGRITEEQRDQALRLCEERPKLRIGEALVESGALSRESLLEALQTQAEGVIFSLFIFPDGRYEIVADDADTPAATDLNISLSSLRSKIEAQEPEWQRIRQAIPSLDTVLDFPEGGRDKLDSARMTQHQKLILSLINGHRPIRDICIAATMLDLEVYKFLFFMVNAKILTRVSAN